MLGPKERACDRLKEKLAEMGADVDAILEELEAEEDEELNRLFAQAASVEEKAEISAEEETTPPQSPTSAKKNNNVLGDLEFPDAPDSPFVGADSTTEDRDDDDNDDDDNEKTKEDEEEEEMEDAQGQRFCHSKCAGGCLGIGRFRVLCRFPSSHAAARARHCRPKQTGRKRNRKQRRSGRGRRKEALKF